jgi:hypothetical protein
MSQAADVLSEARRSDRIVGGVPPAHEPRSGLESLLKKRDGFNCSSAQCIAERFTLELHLDEGDLNGAVRRVWMNVLHPVNRGKIRTAIPNRL